MTKYSIFSSLRNIAPSQLADAELFDFMGLKLDRQSGEIPSVFVSDTEGLDILQSLSPCNTNFNLLL